jgi:VIT1/CCC1 family predicted Fe2+/Mn2+ transporter
VLLSYIQLEIMVSTVEFHYVDEPNHNVNLAIPESITAAASTDSSDDEAEGIITVQVPKYKWKRPADSDSHPYKPHLGEGAQYLRDFILGVNDGLVSIFLLVVAVVAGGSSPTQTLLAGIAGAIAGAISMGLGEYVATKSQTQASASELELEIEHFKYYRDEEIEQLRNFLKSVNLSGNLLEAVVSEVARNDESLLKMMQAFEFGVTEETTRNPIVAMVMSARLFILGSLPSVIPFFFVKDSYIGLAIAGPVAAVSLFAVGAYKTKTTKGNWLWEGGENMMLGLLAAGFSYGIGVAFEAANK